MTPRLQAWLKQAEIDLSMAEFARGGGFYAQACYHCSQAAEKALKGLLIALGEEPPRSHSLERLVDAVALAGLPVEELRDLQLALVEEVSPCPCPGPGPESPRSLPDPPGRRG